MLEASNRQLPAVPLSCRCGGTVQPIHSRDGLRPPDAGPICNAIHEQEGPWNIYRSDEQQRLSQASRAQDSYNTRRVLFPSRYCSNIQ